MRSWDVFDTLIARRYVHSDTIWKKMEEDIDIPNFAQHRRQCNYGTIRGIYTQLAARGVISHTIIDTMVELELRYEEDVCFPIKENMSQVSQGDLLVSDMYFSPPDILRLVRSCGLQPQVSIHASLADKQQGTFWKAMRGHLSLDLHTGDNGHADIALAAAEGFKVSHYVKSQQTKMEKELEARGLKELSMLVREVRLRNYEPYFFNSEIFTIANQFTLPWLVVSSELLYRKNSTKNIVFLGRDCQMLYKIFNTYFTQGSYYLPFSRRAVMKDPAAATQYLKAHIPQNYLLVDISSSGKTWRKLAAHHVFDVEVFHFDHRNDSQIPKNFTWFNKDYSGNARGTNLLFEAFNCADHPMLDSIEVVKGLPIAKFDTTFEIDPDLIRVIQQPVITALELKKHYENLTAELARVDERELWYFFDVLPRSICQFQDGLRHTVFKSFYEKHDQYTLELKKLHY